MSDDIFPDTDMGAKELDGVEVEGNLRSPQLVRTKEGGPKANDPHNASELLDYTNELHGCVGYNTLKYSVYAVRALPWDKTLDYPREWTDADTFALAAHLSTIHAFTCSLPMLDRALDYVARRWPFNPLQDWLGGLVWDGQWRVASMLEVYFGAGPSEYVQAVSLRMMVASVRRALSPGIKHDCMPVLEGAQGIGKSRGVRTLYGSDYFSDSMGAIREINSRDGLQHLAGLWCVEFAELSALRQTDVESLKDFLSGTVDTYRAPYAKRPEEHPRGCVFWGTINPNGAGYLKDMTGNRRFLPLECARVDVDAIERDRDQLWAEAMYWALERDERHWLTSAEEALAGVEQDVRVVGDSWDDLILRWLASPTRMEGEYPHRMRIRMDIQGVVTVGEILEHCLELPPGQHDRAKQMRVADVLHRLGLGKPRERITRRGQRARFWVVP